VLLQNPTFPCGTLQPLQADWKGRPQCFYCFSAGGTIFSVRPPPGEIPRSPYEAVIYNCLQDIDLAEIQRVFKASQQAAEGLGPGGQAHPLAADAVFELNRWRSNWMMPQNEESPERLPLFDKGLELIAEVGGAELLILTHHTALRSRKDRKRE